MLFKPYYLVQAWTKSKGRLQTQFITTEISKGKKCTDLAEATRRADAFAASLNEKRMLQATDWEPKVRLVTDNGNYLVPVR
jgi:hypothetical protein